LSANGVEQVGHVAGVAPLDLLAAYFLAGLVVDDVTAIGQGQRASLAMEECVIAAASLTAATQPFPHDLLLALELIVDDVRVGSFLVVIVAVTAARRRDANRVVDIQGPATQVDDVH